MIYELSVMRRNLKNLDFVLMKRVIPINRISLNEEVVEKKLKCIEYTSPAVNIIEL